MELPNIKKTKGGHKISNFRFCDDEPNEYFTPVYEGELKNDHTKKIQKVRWNQDGQVINRYVPKYDIQL